MSRKLSKLICYHNSEWGADYSSLETEVTAYFDKIIDEADSNVKEDLETKKTAALDALKPKVESLDFWSKVEIANSDKEGIPSDTIEDPINNVSRQRTPMERFNSVSFPTSAKVYHFHPIAFVEQMKRLGTCFCDKDITVEAFEKIFGKGPWFSKSNMRDYAIYNTSTETFVKALNTAMNEHGITSCLQKAHFLAQCYHESARFTTTLEGADGLDYDPGSHKKFHDNFSAYIVFLNKYTSGDNISMSTKVSQKPAEINESIKTYKKAYTDYEAATPTARLTDAIKALKEKHDAYLNFKTEKEKYDTIYTNSYKRHKLKNNATAMQKKEIDYKNWRSAYYRYIECRDHENKDVGDGPKYRGRGIIQITWKDNYKKCKNLMNIDCVTDSSLLASNLTHAINSAAFYWKDISSWSSIGGQDMISKYANEDDFLYVTVGINGGVNGLDDRYEKTQLCLDKFGVKTCPTFSHLQLGDYSLNTSNLHGSNYENKNKGKINDSLKDAKKKYDEKYK